MCALYPRLITLASLEEVPHRLSLATPGFQHAANFRNQGFLNLNMIHITWGLVKMQSMIQQVRLGPGTLHF